MAFPERGDRRRCIRVRGHSCIRPHVDADLSLASTAVWCSVLAVSLVRPLVEV